MIIGIPKIKNRENRVSVVPGGVKLFTENGHTVVIEKGAGLGAGIMMKLMLLLAQLCLKLRMKFGLKLT